VRADEIVAVENGLLHLPTRQPLPHTPIFYTNWALPYAYQAHVDERDRWSRFLREPRGDDQESIATLREICGYLLSGDTSQQKIFMFVGPKGRGMSRSLAL